MSCCVFIYEKAKPKKYFEVVEHFSFLLTRRQDVESMCPDVKLCQLLYTRYVCSASTSGYRFQISYDLLYRVSMWTSVFSPCLIPQYWNICSEFQHFYFR